MIDLERALRLALDAGDVVPSKFTVDVRPGFDDRFVRLSLVRFIGLAQREQATSVSRDCGEPLEFTQRCARAWKALEDQHAAARKETGI